MQYDILIRYYLNILALFWRLYLLDIYNWWKNGWYILERCMKKIDKKDILYSNVLRFEDTELYRSSNHHRIVTWVRKLVGGQLIPAKNGIKLYEKTSRTISANCVSDAVFALVRLF